jgi:hypothetical protein
MKRAPHIDPGLRLLAGMLLICAVAVTIGGCADKPTWKQLGGIGFDLLGAAAQGVVGN